MKHALKMCSVCVSFIQFMMVIERIFGFHKSIETINYEWLYTLLLTGTIVIGSKLIIYDENYLSTKEF